MREFILGYQNSVIIYYWAINGFFIFLLINAFFVIFSRYKKFESQRLDILHQVEDLPSIGIVIPSYNEEDNVIFAIHALLNLSYRNKQITIVNDGSSDNSMEILKSTFKLTPVHRAYVETIPTVPVKTYYHSLLYPELVVIDKDNGGRADAINVGINASKTDFILTLDADTIIDNNEMSRMLRYIFTKPSVAGFGASVRVANGCHVALRGITHVGFPKTYFGGIQAVEYLRAFYLGRMGFDPLGGSLIISGAFSIYETDYVRKIGGFDTHTLGEDMELCTHLKKMRYLEKKNAHTSYIPEPVCWTEVPENYKDLSKQRTRWQIALMEVLWKYKTMFFNPRYGVTGMVIFPFFVFGEFLAPLLELLSYIFMILAWIFGIRDTSYIFNFLIVTWGFTAVLNISCCLIEVAVFRKYFTYKHLWLMLVFSFAENFGYRQLYLWWRLKAFFKIFQSRESWWSGWKKSGFTAMNVEGQRGKKK